MSLREALIQVEQTGDVSGHRGQLAWLKNSGLLRSTKSWCGNWQLSDRGVAYLLGEQEDLR